MPTLEVKIRDIKPNPFRRMECYPINESKVEELRESIRSTGYWDNLLCRRNNGNIELAYGHHRVEALRREKGANDLINVNVHDLDDEAMLKIMARENSETWLGSESIDRETVASLVQAYAEGKVELGKVTKDTPKNAIRYAPSFIQGDVLRGNAGRPYTAPSLAVFLGWGERKTADTLQRLEAMEKGCIKPTTLEGLTKEEATVVVREASKAHRQEKKSAKDSNLNDEEAELVAKKASNDVAVGLALAFKKDEITKKEAPVRALEIMGRTRKKEKQKKELPDISEKAWKVAGHIKKLLNSVRDKEIAALDEIIKYQEYLSRQSRRAIVSALTNMIKRAERYLASLSGGTSLVQRR